MMEVAYAQTGGESDQLQEVIITAERREHDIQKIVASVSVRNGDELQAQGKYSLAHYFSKSISWNKIDPQVSVPSTSPYLKPVWSRAVSAVDASNATSPDVTGTIVNLPRRVLRALSNNRSWSGFSRVVGVVSCSGQQG